MRYIDLTTAKRYLQNRDWIEGEWHELFWLQSIAGFDAATTAKRAVGRAMRRMRNYEQAGKRFRGAGSVFRLRRVDQCPAGRHAIAVRAGRAAIRRKRLPASAATHKRASPPR